MSNKYWRSRDGVPYGPTMCELTKRECVKVHYCSTCPIETRGLSVEEYYLQEEEGVFR